MFTILSYQYCIGEAVLLQNVSDTTKTDTIMYHTYGFNSGQTILLISNNTFVKKSEIWGCTGGGSVNYVTGTFQQEKNKITLMPSDVKVFAYKGFYNQPDTIINVTYESWKSTILSSYYQVDIDDFSLLLSDENYPDSKTNDFLELAKKLEKNHEITDFRSFYFIREKSAKPTFTIDDLPTKWKNILNEAMKN